MANVRLNTEAIKAHFSLTEIEFSKKNFESSNILFHAGNLPRMILSSLPLDLQEIKEDVPWGPVMKALFSGYWQK